MLKQRSLPNLDSQRTAVQHHRVLRSGRVLMPRYLHPQKKDAGHLRSHWGSRGGQPKMSEAKEETPKQYGETVFGLG